MKTPRKRLDALKAGRPVACPLVELIEALEQAGGDTTPLAGLEPDSWVTVYPDNRVVPGITDDADMPSIGEQIND